MTMHNANLPAHPIDQNAVHDFAMGQIVVLREDHPDRERIYIAARAKACTGLTKREAFAMAAMQGLLANPDPRIFAMDEERIAFTAAQHGDALLRALEDTPWA